MWIFTRSKGMSVSEIKAQEVGGVSLFDQCSSKN